MGTVIAKYGGSSLATVEQILYVARRVARSHRADGTRATLVVVSARGDTTDELLALASRVGGGGGWDREVDQLLATGECASAALLAIALQNLGVPAVSLTGPQAGIVAAGRHGSGVVDTIHTGRIRQLLAAGRVVVIAGFQGVNAAGDVVTLGRGGSDTTAVALAAALAADACEIYTDVDGVLTADPRLVPAARVHPRLSARITAELAFAGARVLHPRCVALAGLRGIDIHVGNAASDRLGTHVHSGSAFEGLEAWGGVVGIAHDPQVARVQMTAGGGATPDLVTDVLCLLAEHAVAADMVTMSGDPGRIGFTLPLGDVDRVGGSLRTLARRAGRHDLVRRRGRSGQRGPFDVDDGVAKVSLVGLGLLARPRHVTRMLTALAAMGIRPTALSVSHARASVTTERARVGDAVRALHREFEPDLEPQPAQFILHTA